MQRGLFLRRPQLLAKDAPVEDVGELEAYKYRTCKDKIGSDWRGRG
jgi:hypothetical protein